jgi:hypothetical protein
MSGIGTTHRVLPEVEERDVGIAWTNTLSNNNLLQLKQQREGAKKRNSLMYYIP